MAILQDLFLSDIDNLDNISIDDLPYEENMMTRPNQMMLSNTLEQWLEQKSLLTAVHHKQYT